MKYLAYILILLSPILKGQSIDSIVDSISTSNIVECEIIGWDTQEGKRFKWFKYLRNNAERKQLFELIDHDSASVNAYAARAILDLELTQPEKILKRLLLSNKNILHHCGCLVYEEHLGYHLYDYIWQKNIKYNTDNDTIQLDTLANTKLIMIDSVMLYHANEEYINLDYRIFERKYPDQYYPIIEEWAFVRQNRSAIEYLKEHSWKKYRIKIINTLNQIVEDLKNDECEIEWANELLESIKTTNDNKR